MKKPKKESVIKEDSYGVQSRGDGKLPQIRDSRPEVAAHVARIVVSCNMDFEQATARLLGPEATEEQIRTKADTLAKSSHIREAIEKQLEKIGFGDAAQSRLIALLWKEVLGGNDKRWAAAARLLAEITQAAKANAQNEKIPTLRIGGLEQGLSSMLGPDAPTNDVAHVTIEEDVEIGDDGSITDTTSSPDATGYSTGD
jgi:hypothetical protein